MGRISKALDKLRAKCTEAGVHPKGNTTGDILECIAEHYEGGGGGGDILYIKIKYDEDKGIYYLDNVTFDDITEAATNGKTMLLYDGLRLCNFDGGDGSEYYFSALCGIEGDEPVGDNKGTIEGIGMFVYEITNEGVLRKEYVTSFGSE